MYVLSAQSSLHLLRDNTTREITVSHILPSDFDEKYMPGERKKKEHQFFSAGVLHFMEKKSFMLVAADGVCVHYVMVSTCQWKPFWLVTQLYTVMISDTLWHSIYSDTLWHPGIQSKVTKLPCFWCLVFRTQFQHFLGVFWQSFFAVQIVLVSMITITIILSLSVFSLQRTRIFRTRG